MVEREGGEGRQQELDIYFIFPCVRMQNVREERIGFWQFHIKGKRGVEEREEPD